MANPIGKLSAAKIAQFIKSGKRWIGDGGNLWLYTDDSGQYWIFRWTDRDTAKDRNISLGPLHTISLERARELARENRELLLQRKDPKKHREDQRDDAAIAAGRAKTVSQVAGGLVPPGTSRPRGRPSLFVLRQEPADLPASPGTSDLPKDYWETFIARKSLGYRRSTYIELRDYVHSKIGDVPIQKVDRPMILKCIEGDWTKKYSTVARALRHIQRIFEFAIAKGYYRGENPALWARLKTALPPKEDVYQKKHFRELPFREVGAFLEKVRAHRFHPGLAMELSAVQSGNKNWTVRRRILTLLKDGQSKRLKELGAGAGCRTRASIDNQVQKLVDDGMVERVGRGMCRLSPGTSIDRYFDGRRLILESLGPDDRPTLSLCLEFIILTGCRESEALKAQWKEINIAQMVWNAPWQHCKNGRKWRKFRSHLPRPITKSMLVVLEEMQKRRRDQSDDALIFPGVMGGVMPGPEVARYMRKVIAWETPAQPHGFRGTLRSWNRAGKIFPDEYWAIQVDHNLGDATSQAYGHDLLLEERRPMMEKWDQYCSHPEPAPQTGNVVINLADRRA